MRPGFDAPASSVPCLLAAPCNPSVRQPVVAASAASPLYIFVLRLSSYPDFPYSLFSLPAVRLHHSSHGVQRSSLTLEHAQTHVHEAKGNTCLQCFCALRAAFCEPGASSSMAPIRCPQL